MLFPCFRKEMRHVLATDDTTFRTSKLITAMDKVARMQAGRKLAALKKSEKKSIGKSLAEARKQAKMGSVQETPEVCKFVFKGESDILPSKVTKAEVYRSPFQLSRSSRNLQKCGYSSKEEAYTHPGEGYNPFDMYALQNIVYSLLSCAQLWVQRQNSIYFSSVE